jgi:hypothetical protein
LVLEDPQPLNKTNLIKKIQDVKGFSEDKYVGIFLDLDENRTDQKIFRLMISAQDNLPEITIADGTCFLRVLYQLYRRNLEMDTTDVLKGTEEFKNYINFIEKILKDDSIDQESKTVVNKVKKFYGTKLKSFPERNWQSINFHKKFNIPMTIFERHEDYNYLVYDNINEDNTINNEDTFLSSFNIYELINLIGNPMNPMVMDTVLKHFYILDFKDAKEILSKLREALKNLLYNINGNILHKLCLPFLIFIFV